MGHTNMSSSAVTGKKHQSTRDAYPQDWALHETQWQKVLLFKIKTQEKLQYSHLKWSQIH